MDGNIKVIKYDCVGSTNTEAKEYAIRSDRREPVLFIADEQSAGRGRLGRNFVSRRGQGIYMSLLYFTDESLSDAISVTGAAAVIVARVIEEAVGAQMKIKWVNDIYGAHGKVAGILTESVSLEKGSAIIVGVGINVGNSDFPEELRGIASSIGEVSEEQKNNVIFGIARGLLFHARNCTDRSFIEEYRRRSMLDGEFVELFSAGQSVGSGRVMGISDDGGLIILPDGENETVVIRTGEVSVRKRS